MINQIFTTFSKSFVIAILIYLFEYSIQADFIQVFFSGNLITLLSTLLAINVATLGIVLTRIVELKQPDLSFAKTKNQILLSIREQIGLIFLSLIFSILSRKTDNDYPELLSHGISILFLTIFIYAMFVLYDTAKGLIDIH